MELPENLDGVRLPGLQRTLVSREWSLRERIRQQREAVEPDRPTSETYGDEVDQAQDRERRVVSGDLLDLYLSELGEVEAARARIAQGTYGVCADCSEPIEPKRLDAQPTARRCLACQERRERFGTLAHA